MAIGSLLTAMSSGEQWTRDERLFVACYKEDAITLLPHLARALKPASGEAKFEDRPGLHLQASDLAVAASVPPLILAVGKLLLQGHSLGSVSKVLKKELVQVCTPQALAAASASCKGDALGKVRQGLLQSAKRELQRYALNLSLRDLTWFSFSDDQ